MLHVSFTILKKQYTYLDLAICIKFRYVSRICVLVQMSCEK
jgi:hypothetical protein